ncbi:MULTISPECIES: sensor histidine kinase [unclassified Solwaraspora]|uniref:sensor histidine kinase n=1 Tax=unclassified Solwaraspora TaxID=2627926 RepID=UPI00259BAACD|nr:histidine kinase [Solwaraspora sp. WMMA2056]WJK39249.1 histidine kinase [Solwaraspora sp. WMMA2056]
MTTFRWAAWWHDRTARWPERARRWRTQVVGAGPWRLLYEICLVALVTVMATLAAVGADWYPLAPWLVGLTTPVLMVLRLLHPTTAYVAAALIGLATGGQNSLLLAVLSAVLAYRVARWWQVVAALAVAWVSYVGSTRWSEPVTAELAVAYSALFVLVAIFPAGVARLVRRRRRLLAALHHRNVALRREQGEIARQAQTRERARIARDLHDSLGHKLTLISLYAGMLRTSEGDQRTEATDLVRQTSSAAMTELRQILGILGQDDSQSAVRPLTGLDELAAQARAGGAEVEVVRQGEARPLAALTEHAAYRVIQEGLTNALRHARGGVIVLLLRYESDALVAAVTNTAGHRVARSTSQQGLIGLAERVRIAKGMLYHGPTPDGGFRLAATLPYLGDEPAAAGHRPPPVAGADFDGLIERHQRRSRLTLAVTGLAIAACLALCLAGAWLAMTLVVVDRDTYDAVRIGQSEDEVRAVLPDVDVGVVDADGAGRRTPAGATCVDYDSSILDQADSGTERTLYRFCFRDATLVDKQIVKEPRQ